MSRKILLAHILYARYAAELVNQDLTSTATPEPIQNNTDIIKIYEFTTMVIVYVQTWV